MKKWQILGGLAVALVLVMGLSAAAFAQGGNPPATAPGGTAPEGCVPQGMGPYGNGAQANGAGAGYGLRFGPNGQTLVDVTADVTGLSVEEVVAELQAGATFADVAEAHNKTAADLVNAFVAVREDALAEAVAEGRITQEQADEMLATMRANVEDHVNSTWQPHGQGLRFNGGQPGQGRMLGGRWNR
jgi:hypothetical protein